MDSVVNDRAANISTVCMRVPQQCEHGCLFSYMYIKLDILPDPFKQKLSLSSKQTHIYYLINSTFINRFIMQSWVMQGDAF